MRSNTINHNMKEKKKNIAGCHTVDEHWDAMYINIQGKIQSEKKQKGGEVEECHIICQAALLFSKLD